MSSDSAFLPSTPSTVLEKVPAHFAAARTAGDLLFFPSSVNVHEEAGVKFEIRVCPALQKKPSGPVATPTSIPPSDSASGSASTSNSTSTPASTTSKPDPFAPPYVPNLHVGDLRVKVNVAAGFGAAAVNDDDEDGEEGEYVILLNKYSVVPHHFLLVTKDFRPQTAPLMPTDLVLTYQLLLAAHAAHKPIFAFYNCGTDSGASQAHKHIQFLPLEDEYGPPIERLARAATLETESTPFSLPSLPYAHQIARLPQLTDSSTPSQILAAIFPRVLALLDLAIAAVRHSQASTGTKGTPAYNVIMTRGHIYIVPRGQGEFVFGEEVNSVQSSKGEESSPSASRPGDRFPVNSLGFAGMLLAKSDAELEAVRSTGVCTILRGVGIEKPKQEEGAGEAGVSVGEEMDF